MRADVVPRQLISADGHEGLPDIDQDRRTNKSLERYLVYSLATVDEVMGGIDMGSGVRSKRNSRYVCPRPAEIACCASITISGLPG